MNALFYISSAIAIISAIMSVTRSNAMHALLYLITMLISSAVIFLALGAPFAAALQLIIYAGAIMVLFIFVVMMLNKEATDICQKSVFASIAALPGLLTAILLAGLTIGLIHDHSPMAVFTVQPKEVGRILYTDYLIAVELASILLVAALVAAFHLGVIPTRLEDADD